MSARIIDGKALSKQLCEGFKLRVAKLVAQGVTPGLAVILVGDNPASRVYVGNKVKACEECGVRSFHLALPGDATEAEVLATIARLNADPAVHGILIQLPLPSHIDGRKVLEAISVHKDVDGFHLYNVGGLVVGNTIFPPCTPYGVQLLLDTTGTDVAGKNVVVGASNIVGKPMALMLLQREATVTICHAKTRDLAQHTILADILIVAAGRPGLIVPQMVKQGAIVIDVGINRLPDGKIVGDVDFKGVKEKASWITPVPGGVGPMTVTMLIENTLRSAQRALHVRDSDDIRHTVDYDQVVDRLEALLASRHFHLLEHLSQAVLDTLGDSFPVKRAEVTLAKPLAVPKARRVSVTRKAEWRREAVKAVPLAM